MVCAAAQNAGAAKPAPALAPTGAAPLVSKACQTGSSALASAESPLPNVANALAHRKTLRILTFGAAPGRVGRHGDYTDVIETMLQDAMKGVDVIMINRGVSGELAADAAARMKNEVALEEPDLVLWQVGTNDALAYVPVEEFTEAVNDQIDWLRAHKVDLVLVGLQFAPPTLRDTHYVKIREALRKLAEEEERHRHPLLRSDADFNGSQHGRREPITDQFERSESGYNCLAEYVARVITLSVFAKDLPKRSPANRLRRRRRRKIKRLNSAEAGWDRT